MHVHFQINGLSICCLLPTSFAILITISNYFVHKSPGLKFEFTSGHETEAGTFSSSNTFISKYFDVLYFKKNERCEHTEKKNR